MNMILNKRTGKKENTALANRHFSTGHSFNFQGVEILDHESNYKERCISELVYINNHTVNWTHTAGVNNIYFDRLNKYKNMQNNPD